MNGLGSLAGKHNLVKGSRELLLKEIPAAVRERFVARLRPAGDGGRGCLLYTGALNGDGYGVVVISVGRRNRRYALAHRIAYAIAFGTCPPLLLDHTCEVRSCCLAAHLRPTTEEGNTPGIYGTPAIVRATRPRPIDGWGPACLCRHFQLVHRGAPHLGACGALQCAVIVDGRAVGSRCAEFRPAALAIPESVPTNTWSDA